MSRLVLVEWRDARFIEGWYERDNAQMQSGIECVTAGILIREDEKDIVVAAHRNEEHFAGAMAIPKTQIRRIRRLKVRRD